MCAVCVCRLKQKRMCKVSDEHFLVRHMAPPTEGVAKTQATPTRASKRC